MNTLQWIPCSDHARYNTFNGIYKQRWQDILRFRHRTTFTQCEVCMTLKQDLNSRSISFDQKLGSLQMYPAHLRDQFCDRTVCWKMQAIGAEPTSDLICICIDGRDQAKFALPRDPALRSSAALHLSAFTRRLCV